MKLNILSDLHLGFASMAPPRNDADVVVLAGDIGRPDAAIAWAAALDKPVLYVPGNHEFYGDSIDGTLGRLRQLCAGTCVDLLDSAEVFLGGVRFLGATLWTDFRLFNTPALDAAARAEAVRCMRDFSRIRGGAATQSPFQPDDAARLFARQSRWLARALARPFDGPTVVITHHAPSRSSIHPRYDGALLNACFVSDAEHLLDAGRVALWVHGHTHDSFDYTLGRTRVVCNPRGYARNGVCENAQFDADFIVEIAGAPSDAGGLGLSLCGD
jgi:predicted phosphodiesterase